MQTQTLKSLQNNIHLLGFQDIYSFASNQAKLLLIGKIEHYLNTIKFYEKKHKMSFLEFEKELSKLKNKENFEKEDDLLDWRFSIETIKMYEKELKSLK